MRACHNGKVSVLSGIINEVFVGTNRTVRNKRRSAKRAYRTVIKPHCYKAADILPFHKEVHDVAYASDP